jgi:hypothetical protein
MIGEMVADNQLFFSVACTMNDAHALRRKNVYEAICFLTELK